MQNTYLSNKAFFSANINHVINLLCRKVFLESFAVSGQNLLHFICLDIVCSAVQCVIRLYLLFKHNVKNPFLSPSLSFLPACNFPVILVSSSPVSTQLHVLFQERNLTSAQTSRSLKPVKACMIWISLLLEVIFPRSNLILLEETTLAIWSDFLAVRWLPEGAASRLLLQDFLLRLFMVSGGSASLEMFALLHYK